MRHLMGDSSNLNVQESKCKINLVFSAYVGCGLQIDHLLRTFAAIPDVRIRS